MKLQPALTEAAQTHPMFGTKSLSSPASPQTSSLVGMIDKSSAPPLPLSNSSPSVIDRETIDQLASLSVSQISNEAPIVAETNASLSTPITQTEGKEEEEASPPIDTQEEKSVRAVSSKPSKSVNIQINYIDDNDSNYTKLSKSRKSYAVGLPSFTLREEIDISVTSADIIDCILE